ncbi:MAG: hypothetical protein M3436_08030 [Pseudomonadota bacterium]|nr:hypothetical protein [Pseudomonadota bacterium]
MRQHHYAEGPPIAAFKYHKPLDRQGCPHAGRRGGVGGTAAGGSAVEKVDVRVSLRYSWDSDARKRRVWMRFARLTASCHSFVKPPFFLVVTWLFPIPIFHT